MNGGDEFYVRFENNESKEVAFAEVTDNDDGSYAVKFSTTVRDVFIRFGPPLCFSDMFISLQQAAGMYTCSVMIGADEHVADSPYPVLPLHMRCVTCVFDAFQIEHLTDVVPVIVIRTGSNSPCAPIPQVL
jgi:hypothetical protein